MKTLLAAAVALLGAAAFTPATALPGPATGLSVPSMVETVGSYRTVRVKGTRIKYRHRVR